MADISDVFDALAAVIQGVIYPNGTGQPSAITVNGQPISARIYPGWPIPANLDADLAATNPQIVNISLYVPPGHWKNTTRYRRTWSTSTPAMPTLTLTVNGAGTTVTVGGTVTAPQNVAVLCNGKGVAYAVQAGDTLASIAIALAAQITAQITPAGAAGPVVTVPAAYRLIGRAGGVGTVIQEVMREEQRFQVTFWSPVAILPAAPDAIRRAISAPVKFAFANMNFLTLADGSAARIITAADFLNDTPEKTTLLRRDLFYQVEYGTTQILTAAEVLIFEVLLYGGFDPTNQPLIADIIS